MRYYSEDEVRKLIEETDIHDGIRGTADEYLSIMKGIEIPDEHGRCIDADELYKTVDSMDKCSMSEVIVHILDAPTVLEANK